MLVVRVRDMGHEIRAGVNKMERMEMRMCGVSLKERQHSSEMRRRLGVEEIGDVSM